MLVVNQNVSPHQTVGELITHLRDKGKDANNLYGSNGHFATDHLATLAFLDSRGVTAVHDPRTGSQPMINDLITKKSRVGFLIPIARSDQGADRERLYARARHRTNRAAGPL